VATDFDLRTKLHGLLAVVVEVDQLRARLDRSRARAEALARVLDEPATGPALAATSAMTQAALRRIEAERPRLLALIAAAHGHGPRD
jgi:hypothetical protein